MRSIRLIRLALAAALLAFAPVPARALAQNAEPAAATTSTESATAGQQVATAPAATSAEPSGLPAQGGPPRTLRAYWHVYVAFTLAWLLVFGYAISLGRRFGRLERELDARTAA